MMPQKYTNTSILPTYTIHGASLNNFDTPQNHKIPEFLIKACRIKDKLKGPSTFLIKTEQRTSVSLFSSLSPSLVFILSRVEPDIRPFLISGIPFHLPDIRLNC